MLSLLRPNDRLDLDERHGLVDRAYLIWRVVERQRHLTATLPRYRIPAHRHSVPGRRRPIDPAPPYLFSVRADL
jgi:hypothetical protein